MMQLPQHSSVSEKSTFFTGLIFVGLGLISLTTYFLERKTKPKEDSAEVLNQKVRDPSIVN